MLLYVPAPFPKRGVKCHFLRLAPSWLSWRCFRASHKNLRTFSSLDCVACAICAPVFDALWNNIPVYCKYNRGDAGGFAHGLCTPSFSRNGIGEIPISVLVASEWEGWFWLGCSLFSNSSLCVPSMTEMAAEGGRYSNSSDTLGL